MAVDKVRSQQARPDGEKKDGRRGNKQHGMCVQSSGAACHCRHRCSYGLRSARLGKLIKRSKQRRATHAELRQKQQAAQSSQSRVADLRWSGAMGKPNEMYVLRMYGAGLGQPRI